jgi:AFG3 family protein
MSEDPKNTETPNIKNENSQQNQDDERKKQFEKMKEKFSKQSPLGGGSGGKNAGNNFYWIYGLVIVGLLFVTFFGTNFSSRMIEISQVDFEQKMLAHGDVAGVDIVNEKEARIYINPDSLALLDQYKDKKTGLAFFPDKKFKGPHFRLTISSVDDFLRRIEKVQDDAGISKDKRVYPHSVDETNWGSELTWIAPILIMVVLWMLMMRRMGGGGSGGGPGQIFNIGKSKAQHYLIKTLT